MVNDFLTGATTLDALIGIDPSDYKVGLNTWSPKWAVSLGFVGEISINVITPALAAAYGYAYTTNPVLLNDTFRHAVAMSIDKQKLVDDALLGYGNVADTLVPDVNPWHHSIPASQQYKFDPAAARALLNSQGWVYDGTGANKPGATPLYRKDATGRLIDGLVVRFYTLNTRPQWEIPGRASVQWLPPAVAQITDEMQRMLYDYHSYILPYYRKDLYAAATPPGVRQQTSPPDPGWTNWGNWSSEQGLVPDSDLPAPWFQVSPLDNQAPVVASFPAVQWINGAPVSVSVSANDPEGGALGYTWNFGDGTPIQTSASGSTTHTFAQPGNYTVQVRIKDSEWTTCTTTTATIVAGGGPGANLPPQIKSLDFRLSHSTFGVPGETIRFNLTVNDTEGDPLYVTWNFGDGSVVAVNYVTNTLTDKTVSQQHAYTANKTYSLVAVVTDNKTGTLNHRPNVTALIVIQTISTPGGSIPTSSNPWINYGLLRLMPGDPALSLTPRDPKYQGLAEYNRELFGFDKPPWEQFAIYLQRTVTLDWGVSYRLGLPVFDVLMRDLGWTLVLVGTSTVATIIIGMFIGSIAAQKRGKPFDILSTATGIFLYGMPIFWLGFLLLAMFEKGSIVGHYFTWWPALPSQGYYDDMLGPWAWDGAHLASAAQHLILPALTLTLGTLAGISLVMRSSLIDVMTEDFVTTAKAKGLSDRQVLRRHILPSGLPPMVALIALDIAFVIGGAYQVEVVFNYYGIGWETIQAIDNLDFPLLQFIIVVGGVAIVLANLVSDFILLLLDPRIKVS